MDLITRGAGFGYFGGSVTSLIYASFTFIFFALEGSIMAQGLHLGLGLAAVARLRRLGADDPAAGDLRHDAAVEDADVDAAAVADRHVPAVHRDRDRRARRCTSSGRTTAASTTSAFSFVALGAGAGIALSLIAQIGEQVDYLRFMPAKTKENARGWWAAVIAAGPGWVILGALKQLGGAFLAFYVIGEIGQAKAVEPVEQFFAGFDEFLPYTLALAIAVLFVVLSQVKINVTNAYSGSLRWTNFFSTVFKWYPGRVYFVFFNVAIALVLMEANMFSFLNELLGFYSNVAIAWIGAVVADLVINKPLLKTSPSFIEYKRGHLPAFNPVGFGAMGVASVVSIVAYFGAFGEFLDAWSPFLAITIAMVLSPRCRCLRPEGTTSPAPRRSTPAERSTEQIQCSVCLEHYEKPDIIGCPFHKRRDLLAVLHAREACGSVCKD